MGSFKTIRFAIDLINNIKTCQACIAVVALFINIVSFINKICLSR